MIAAACGGGEPANTAATATAATVARVVDGDTIVLADDRRVRLVQIDSPEQGDECYAAQATAELRSLLPPGTRVRLEGDPALDGVDRYHRLLRYVLRDGENLNLELVRRGAAAPYFYRGVRGRHADRLLDAAEAARSAPRGLWAACLGTPLEPDRQVDTGPAG